MGVVSGVGAGTSGVGSTLKVGEGVEVGEGLAEAIGGGSLWSKTIRFLRPFWANRGVCPAAPVSSVWAGSGEAKIVASPVSNAVRMRNACAGRGKEEERNSELMEKNQLGRLAVMRMTIGMGMSSGGGS